nr:hypothetical protein [Tanacetum cinerariifolium]
MAGHIFDLIKSTMYGFNYQSGSLVVNSISLRLSGVCMFELSILREEGSAASRTGSVSCCLELSVEEEDLLTLEVPALKNSSYKGPNRSKELFDQEMRKVNDFVAMDSEPQKSSAKEAQESSTKRTAEHLESDISKKQNVDENVEPVIDDSEELRKCIEIVHDDRDENFNREDLEVLWAIVKDRFKKEKPMDDMDNILFRTLKTMFEHHVEDTI